MPNIIIIYTANLAGYNIPRDLVSKESLHG